MARNAGNVSIWWRHLGTVRRRGFCRMMTTLTPVPLAWKHFPDYWPFVRGMDQWIPLTKNQSCGLWGCLCIIINKLLKKQSSCRLSATSRHTCDVTVKVFMKTSSNETFSALLALCEWNPRVTGGFPSQRPVTQSFGVFSDLRLKKRLIETPQIWDAIALIMTSL